MSTSPSCPACGGAFGPPAPYPGAAAHVGALRFEGIVSCSACGLGMALPAYTQGELDAFYSSGAYWNDAVGHSRAQTLHERNQCRHRVHRALTALPATASLRVLDVGAGHAWTAYWIERVSPGTLEAFDFIEPDDACSQAVLARPTRYRTKRVRTLAEAQPGYQLIFLNHVLEHVTEPLAAVRYVRKLLAPDGVAYFEMPDADQRFKADVFPHTWFFTPEALAQLAAHTGLKEHIRESFGRMPSRSGADLVWRACFRAAAALGLADLAGVLDDRIWRYGTVTDGIWIRWLVARPSQQGISTPSPLAS